MNSRTKQIHEVLKLVSEAKTKEEKVTILRENDGVPLRTILKLMYDPAITFKLPPGRPPFKPYVGLDSNMILRLSRHFTMFTNEYGNKDHTQYKVESVFLGDLESVDPGDAEVMLNMKDKKKVSGLTVKVLNEAYPGIVPEVE